MVGFELRGVENVQKHSSFGFSHGFLEGIKVNLKKVLPPGLQEEDFF
jgi:hypothetical protein